MYVCICNSVTDRAIRDAAHRHGVSTMEELGRRLKVATRCGSCRECAQDVLGEALAERARGAAA